MRRTSAIYAWFAMAIFGAVFGCNKAPFDVAPVRGSVTVDGQPMKAGKVMFAPIRTGSNLETGKPAIGVIREDGTFVLSTYGNDDGAVVGDHWVTIFGPDPPSALSPPPNSQREPTAEARKFDRLNITEKQTVRPRIDNQFNITLTSSDIANHSIHAD